MLIGASFEKKLKSSTSPVKSLSLQIGTFTAVWHQKHASLDWITDHVYFFIHDSFVFHGGYYVQDITSLTLYFSILFIWIMRNKLFGIVFWIHLQYFEKIKFKSLRNMASNETVLRNGFILRNHIDSIQRLFNSLLK